MVKVFFSDNHPKVPYAAAEFAGPFLIIIPKEQITEIHRVLWDIKD